jgi:hypothetical protein
VCAAYGERKYRCNSESAPQRTTTRALSCSAQRLASCIWSKTTESFLPLVCYMTLVRGLLLYVGAVN